jgi:RimJ/RimL family protein N-acetyltransferase
VNGAAPRLRPWREADLPLLQQWRNDVPLQAQLLARARGSDSEAVRRWLAERSAPPRSLLLVVADAASDEALGYLQVVDIDADDRRGELGICLGPQAQDRGIGTAALRLALERLKQEHGLRKINLRVRSDNARALRCYDRLGFARCGTWGEHVFLEGAWRDVVLMEKFL